MAVPPKKTQSSRLPAPVLFKGPPSRNASSTSLLQAQPHHGPQRTHLPSSTSEDPIGTQPRLSPSKLPATALPKGPGRHNSSNAPVKGQSPAAAERIESLWAHMQSTLEEVELNATGAESGTARFGPGHAKALEELRCAQIALAEAWGRSVEDSDAKGVAGQELRDKGGGVGGDVSKAERKGELADNTGNLLSAAAAAATAASGGDAGTAKATAAAGRSRSPSATSDKSDRIAVEEDTERDLENARRRREANDRYFQRINAEVADVVSKLEEVAQAMKQVEMQSREMWSDVDSIDTRSHSQT